jgi:hypothetical protein
MLHLLEVGERVRPPASSNHLHTVGKVAKSGSRLIKACVNSDRNKHDISQRIEEFDTPAVSLDPDEPKSIKQHLC